MLIFPFIWTGIRTWKLLTTSQTWGKRCWLPLVNVNTFMLCVWNLKPNWPVWIQKRNSSYCCAYRHKKQLKKKRNAFAIFCLSCQKTAATKPIENFDSVCTHHFLSLTHTHTNTLIFKLLTPYVHYWETCIF